jgi:ATP-dependent protease Clp ATPase subunit
MSNDNCSFCGKRHDQVFRLVAGPDCMICSECIGRCANLIASELERVAADIIALPPVAQPGSEGSEAAVVTGGAASDVLDLGD